jgi:hypothetical protein
MEEMMFKLFLFIVSIFVQAQPVIQPARIINQEWRIVKYQAKQSHPHIVCHTYISHDPTHPAILTLCDIER